MAAGSAEALDVPPPATNCAARAVKASATGLAQLPLPAIVHWDGNHWVVLYDVSDTRTQRV
jgi:ABC-type bacteriocin/lantibiotic exporter with double-glycine peptidase domain